MKGSRKLVSLVLSVVALLALVGWQTKSDALDIKQIRATLDQLGYTVKDVDTTEGNELYQITVTTGGLDIPIRVQLSKSKSNVWLTVFLRDMKTDDGKALPLLKQNALIQPSQFYVTDKGSLTCGLNVENRGITNAVLKSRIDKIAGDVADSKSLWQLP